MKTTNNNNNGRKNDSWRCLCYSVNSIVCSFFDCGIIPTTEDVKSSYKLKYGTPCALFTEEIEQIINAVRVYEEKRKAILNK